jgi:hypothetical protein
MHRNKAAGESLPLFYYWSYSASLISLPANLALSFAFAHRSNDLRKPAVFS